MITVYYIDLRAPGRYIKVLEQVQALPNVKFVKGKVAEALQAPGDKVTLVAENALTGQKSRIEYDLAVLATGMQPSLAAGNLPFPINLDEDGFVEDGSAKGIFTAGCAKMPLDVSRTAQSGTAAALYATQIIKGASNGK
jgi:quinone-modifying oxidoreductase subunit QmoA